MALNQLNRNRDSSGGGGQFISGQIVTHNFIGCIALGDGTSQTIGTGLANRTTINQWNDTEIDTHSYHINSTEIEIKEVAGLYVVCCAVHWNEIITGSQVMYSLMIALNNDSNIIKMRRRPLYTNQTFTGRMEMIRFTYDFDIGDKIWVRLQQESGANRTVIPIRFSVRSLSAFEP